MSKIFVSKNIIPLFRTPNIFCVICSIYSVNQIRKLAMETALDDAANDSLITVDGTQSGNNSQKCKTTLVRRGRDIGKKMLNLDYHGNRYVSKSKIYFNIYLKYFSIFYKGESQILLRGVG